LGLFDRPVRGNLRTGCDHDFLCENADEIATKPLALIAAPLVVIGYEIALSCAQPCQAKVESSHVFHTKNI
jgi:hypothetical protein